MTSLAELALQAESCRHHAFLLINRTFAERGLTAEDFALLARAYCGIDLLAMGADGVWEMATHHPDVVVVDRERTLLRLDEVAPIRKVAWYPPNLARRRLFFIDRAERLNVNAANSLLKIIEEPDIQALFLLTARSRTEVLPTISSRCQVVPVSMPEVERPTPSEAFEPEDWAWLKQLVEQSRTGWPLVMTSLWDEESVRISPFHLGELLEKSQQLGQKYDLSTLQDGLMSLLVDRWRRDPAWASAARFLWSDLVAWRDMAPMNPSAMFWLSRICLRLRAERG